MTARIRIAVAVAILFALAAHPLAHPMVKECPCTHAVGVPAVERFDSFVLHVVSRAPLRVTAVVETRAVATVPSRAPPASDLRFAGFFYEQWSAGAAVQSFCRS